MFLYGEATARNRISLPIQCILQRPPTGIFGRRMFPCLAVIRRMRIIVRGKMANRKRQPEDGPYVRPWRKRPRPPEITRLRRKERWLNKMISYHSMVGEDPFMVGEWRKELLAVKDRIAYLEERDALLDSRSSD